VSTLCGERPPNSSLIITERETIKQAFVFAALGIMAFVRLARLAEPNPLAAA
jgi:hypothetical protein